MVDSINIFEINYRFYLCHMGKGYWTFYRTCGVVVMVKIRMVGSPSRNIR